MLYSREFRGPITAVESLEKCLLVAMGSKLLLHYWDGAKLTEAAFFDAPLLITSLNVIKVTATHSNPIIAACRVVC
jgi:cleavage and polyadenylation specificity factor subunit 1